MVSKQESEEIIEENVVGGEMTKIPFKFGILCVENNDDGEFLLTFFFCLLTFYLFFSTISHGL